MKKQGSIVIIVLLVLSLIATPTTQLVRRATVHAHFDKVVLNREKAKMLALGGLNLAISQLTVKPDDDKARIEKEEDPVVARRKKLLEKILPALNTWQTYELDAVHDGLAGQIKLCLMCEDGKININEIFDFKTGEFRKEYVPWLQGLQLGEGSGAKGDFAKNLAKFLKERGRKLDDISELYALDDVQRLSLYYQPPAPLKQGDPAYAKASADRQPGGEAIALSDLFTVNTHRRSVEPWLLSNALCTLFGVRTRQADDATTRKDAFKKAIGGYKKGLGRNWQENFSVLQHIYESRPRALPRLAELFSKEFDPTVFTVLSSGTVQTVEARVLAVLVREVLKQDKPKDAPVGAIKQNSQQRPIITYRVAKLYWL